MPGKYRIEAEYSLVSQVEPDGRIGGIEDAEYVLDFEDMSSFDTDEVRCSGGHVSFEVEADGEDQARNRAEDVLGSAHYSGDGYFEWEVDDFEITSIEEIEPPMDLERALVLIRAYLDREVEALRMDSETQTAFLFLLDKVTP